MNIQKLPRELIYIILEYAGIIKMRAGKPMRQLDMKDEKYEILTRIRPVEQRRHDTWSVFLPIPKRNTILRSSEEGYELKYNRLVYSQTVYGRHFVGCLICKGNVEEYVYKLYFIC